jgi:rod shape determining protein RodA
MSESKDLHSQQTVVLNEPVLLVPGQEIKDPRLIWSKIIMFAMFALIVIGMINLYSAAMGTSLFWSQLKNLVIALASFFVCGWLIPPRHYNTYAYWFFGIVCFLLVLVDVMGGIAMGAQRWLKIGPIVFQPSELAKIAVAMVVAKFFHTSRLARPYTLRDLVPLATIVGVVFGTAVMRSLFLSIAALSIPKSWEFIIVAIALMAAVLTDEVIRIVGNKRKLMAQAKLAKSG